VNTSQPAESSPRPVPNGGGDVPAAPGDAALYACWNEIGVHGDGTCPELKKYVRCRNCPVYSNAGIKLLDRPMPEDYRREWTEHYSQRKRTPAPNRASAILFRIGGEWLALPAHTFQEIADRRPIHSLPHRRQAIVLGLANVRGELLICMSLGHLLRLEGLPSLESLRRNHNSLLVAEWNGKRLVFPVNELRGIHRYEPRELKEPPATIAKSTLSYTRGILHWEGITVGLLDPEVLFTALNRSMS
jgi:chemotaxis-related protein WspD